MLPNGELSGGMHMLGCEADLAGEVPTASAICWRRTNLLHGDGLGSLLAQSTLPDAAGFT